MDLPEGARVKTEQGVWKVRWRKYLVVVGPSSKLCHDLEVAQFAKPVAGQYAHLVSITVTPVTFDRVRGMKRVDMIRDLGSRSVNYALEVPGGFASALIMRRGLAWDESECEQFFHTIQMIRNDTAAASQSPEPRYEEGRS